MFLYNVNQAVILDRLQEYLRQENRDPKQTERLKQGYCSGISSLWLYARWLQTQPYAAASTAATSSSPVRDDYTWFQATTKLIAEWDKKRQLTPTETAEFERFLSYIEYFQNISDYLPIAQGNLDQSFTDSKDRTLKKEYTIGALLTLHQLKFLLRTSGIIQEKKLILISSHNHATALFKEGNQYYYFNANNPTGEIRAINIDKVATLIFEAHLLDQNKPSPLGLRIFSLDATPGVYPDTKQLLDNIAKLSPGGLKVEGEQKYAYGFSGLMQAVRVGSVEAVKYYLAKEANPHLADMYGNTPLNEAIYRGNIEIIQTLLADYPIQANAKQDVAKSLMIAAGNNQHDAVELLLKDGNKVGYPTWSLAVSLLVGSPEIRKLLFSYLKEKFKERQAKVVNWLSILMRSTPSSSKTQPAVPTKQPQSALSKDTGHHKGNSMAKLFTPILKPFSYPHQTAIPNKQQLPSSRRNTTNAAPPPSALPLKPAQTSTKEQQLPTSGESPNSSEPTARSFPGPM